MRGFLLLASLCLPAVAGTIDDRHPDSRYLEYATGFAPYTLRIEAINKHDNPMLATAVAISDHYALTAGHVAKELSIGFVTSGTSSWRIGEIHLHPEFRDGGMGVADLAVLELPEGLALGFYPPLCDGGESEGGVVSIAGYGLTGRLSEGYTLDDGKLRAGTNTIHRIDPGVIVCLAMPGSSPLEYCIAPGCSGGPLFLGGKLAGINSYTSRDPGGPGLRSRTGEESGHTRVSVHREWILSIARELTR
jgi:hypothetical protein